MNPWVHPKDHYFACTTATYLQQPTVNRFFNSTNCMHGLGISNGDSDGPHMSGGRCALPTVERHGLSNCYSTMTSMVPTAIRVNDCWMALELECRVYRHQTQSGSFQRGSFLIQSLDIYWQTHKIVQEMLKLNTAQKASNITKNTAKQNYPGSGL